MEELFETTHSSLFSLTFLVGCPNLSEEKPEDASCGTNEKFDRLRRVCVSTFVAQAPPVPLTNFATVEESDIYEIKVYYTDINNDVATTCQASEDNDDLESVACDCNIPNRECTVTAEPEDENFNGTTRFSYRLNDGENSEFQEVLLVVTPVDDAPEITNDDFIPNNFTEDSGVNQISFQYNDEDGGELYSCRVSEGTSDGGASFLKAEILECRCVEAGLCYFDVKTQKTLMEILSLISRFSDGLTSEAVEKTIEVQNAADDPYFFVSLVNIKCVGMMNSHVLGILIQIFRTRNLQI